MVRPCKCRCVGNGPKVAFFKPCGIPRSEIEEVTLTVDEFEAVKLADLLGLYQEEAAEKMKVSRQTFGNIIESARKKLGDVIVNAKGLKIEGGNYTLSGIKQGKGRCCRRSKNQEDK